MKDAARKDRDVPMHVFTLYVAGLKPVSHRAVRNLQTFCETHLAGRHRITVVDLAEKPQAAIDDNVIVIPTLIKSWPLPPQTFVGDLSETASLLSALMVGPYE